MKRFELSKIGCLLIGWNHDILQRCGEASHRQFRKLVSAVFIMMILWGTIGFCFAKNYFGIEPLIGQIAVSIAFIFIIVCIERVIILTVGRARFMAFIRVLLASLMAVLGSCVFDQMIFKNDIAEAIAIRREAKIKEVTKSRIAILDDDVARIKAAMDSLSNNITQLSEDIEKMPVIKSRNEGVTPVSVTDANGNTSIVNRRSVTEQSFANPKVEQLNSNMELYKKYTTDVDSLTKSKMVIQDLVVKEFEKKAPGFLEDLLATVDVISESWVTMLFYFVMFGVLMMLELFVVSIKMGDTKCDYDLLVERQLHVKEEVLKKMEGELLKTQGTDFLQ